MRKIEYQIPDPFSRYYHEFGLIDEKECSHQTVVQYIKNGKKTHFYCTSCAKEFKTVGGYSLPDDYKRLANQPEL